MPKNKSHKSSLKRIRLTKTGLVRHNRAGGKHLRSHKSSTRLRRLRTDKTMSSPEAKRLEKLLFRRLRGRDQARATLKRSPSPEARKAAKAAAKAAPAKKAPAAKKTGVKKAVAAKAPAAKKASPSKS
jgi:large subunit ribosomal protein L35